MKPRIIVLAGLLLAIVAAAPPLKAQTLTQADRDLLAAHLEKTRKALIDATAGLSAAQWNFKPAPERWSVAECVEHLALSEDRIFQLVTERMLKSPAEPEKKEATKGKEDLILKVIPDRSQKFQAPEPLLPHGKWATPEETLRHFRESRAHSIEYVKITQDDLHGHFFDHPVAKTLDGYQWLLLMSAHTQRHTAQLLEVKANPDFPTGTRP
jgi:hypothetical protein